MRLRKYIPFVSLIVVLLVAACAPVTPVIPQTGPDPQGGTAMPGDSGQGGTAMPGDSGQGDTGGTGGTSSGQGDTGGTDGTGGTDSGNNQGGAGSNQGGTGTGGTGSAGGIIGGQGGSGGNTAPSPSGSQFGLSQNLQNNISQFVSQESGGVGGDVEFLFAQQIDFQNGCLDLSSQGEMCSQAITPGWQVVARSNGNLYMIHTDTTGNNVRWNQNADPSIFLGSGAGTGNNQGGTGTGTGNNQDGTGSGSNQGGSTGGNTGGTGTGSGGSNQGGGADGGGLRVGLDQVINLASQFLGQTLNVPLNQVALTSVTVETWPDACLGLAQGDTNCAQVATPGYRISFSAGGQNYELRTDSTGSNIRLVQGGQQ